MTTETTTKADTSGRKRREAGDEEEDSVMVEFTSVKEVDKVGSTGNYWVQYSLSTVV